MSKSNPKTNTNSLVRILDILALLLSIAVLAAISQHIDHLNQLASHLLASQTVNDRFSIKPDYQLVPLVPVTLLVFIGAVLARKKVSTLLLISFAIFISALTMGLFGLHLAHPGLTRF